MAGIFFCTKSWWDNLSVKNKALLTDVLLEYRLGEPAFYSLGAGTYAVWSHHAMRQGHVERMGRDLKDAANRSLIVKDYPLTETVEVEVPLRVEEEREALDDNGDSFDPPEFYTVWVDHPTETVLVEVEVSLGDPFDLAMKAQEGPTQFRALTALPANAVPYDPEG